MNAPVVAVTVLEDRAQVTRRGRAPLAAGQHRVTIERVSPILADKTLLASAAGARVLDVRCERYLAPWRDPDGGAGDDLPARLRAERVRLEQQHDAEAARADAARAELAALGALAGSALHDLAVAASRGLAPGDASGELDALDALEAAARQRLTAAELAVRDHEAALARLDARLAAATATAGEQAARLVIDVVADEAGDATVTVDYVVPNAAWRPYHRAVLVREAGAAARVDWTTTACVWQATGEDWTDAALTCSLERASLGVEPPALADDELRTRRRPDTVVVEAREHAHHTTGLGAGGAAQVPGIDDGGLGVVLSAPRATVRADGAPHRVPVGGFEAPARLALVAIPLRSPAVHLRARLANGSAPLLAGPVDLVASAGYVGRAEVGFVAAGETFELGFGPESDLRVHRDETRTRDDAGLLGGWNVTTVRVAVRLSNLGAAAREVEVTERIPISEVAQVEVQLAPPDAYRLGAGDPPGGEAVTQVTARELDDRGLVTWTVELPAYGRRAVTLEYQVRSQRGVAGV